MDCFNIEHLHSNKLSSDQVTEEYIQLSTFIKKVFIGE